MSEQQATGKLAHGRRGRRRTKMACPEGVDDRQIGQALRSLRITNGLSMQQLSERTGAHLQSIARYV
jgi:hypothetical protein